MRTTLVLFPGRSLSTDGPPTFPALLPLSTPLTLKSGTSQALGFPSFCLGSAHCPLGQMQPVACFWVACELRVAPAFLNG